MLKFNFVLVLFFSISFAHSQNLIQIGQRIKYGNQNLNFTDYESDNKPEDLFNAEVDFQNVATETVLKISGLKIKEDFIYNIGYSLEFGYMFSKENMSTVFVEGEYEYDHFPIGTVQTIEKYNRQISITNNIEFNYRISKYILFSNSLGLRLESKDIYKHNGNVSELYVKGKYRTPIIAKISYSPQLLITLDKFSMNLHLTQDIFRINYFFNQEHPKLYGFGSNAHLATYTGFGIFLIPHFSIRTNESELLQEDFDY